MLRFIRCLPAALVALVLWAPINPAAAHAFGQRYDLPLPLSYYVVGAGAAVALSFLIMVLFVRQRQDAQPPRRLVVSEIPGLSLLGHRWVIGTLRLLSVGLFFLVLLSGLIGTVSATKNFAPTFVWVIWWVGFAYVQALLGDLWSVINPWNTLFRWAEALWRRLRGGAVLSLALPYPQWLGRWPAVLLFWSFAWLEVVSDAADNPRDLAAVVIGYSLITWGGMLLFGRAVWLARGEAFTLVFGLLARFAPFAGSGPIAGQDDESDSEDQAHSRLVLRPYGVGLLVQRPLETSVICLVLLMLATVTFDGFGETPLWADVLDWVVGSETLRAPLLALQGAGFNLLSIVQTAALLLAPFLFYLVYAFFSALTAWASGARLDARGGACSAAGSFVLTLVPIAIAYHLAHYFSFLLFAGQLMIPLSSDPFGFGWNLFGTANYTLDIGVVSMRSIWYLAIAAIVIGHVYAVYLAHVMALRLYAKSRAALLSQLPLMALMVAYTMVSLWILSQPIVESG